MKTAVWFIFAKRQLDTNYLNTCATKLWLKLGLGNIEKKIWIVFSTLRMIRDFDQFVFLHD